jgi:hypothetical protein
MQEWELLEVPDYREDAEGFRDAIRLNSLGSLFFFINTTLRKDRLASFHHQMCSWLETEDLHEVMEVPMGHFKTTCGSIGYPVWSSLPFTAYDEEQMRALGYGDEWIRFMGKMHNANTRNLITHEIEGRATDMGKEVDDVYQNNDLFRAVFPEIIPDASCVWNDHSKFQKRDKSKPSDATNATYAYRGVGQALQGVRADRTIQDDNFGKAAQDNMLKGDGRMVDDVYRWHNQLSTRLDRTRDGRILGQQLVIGNRWGHDDLNSRIKKNQPHFHFETHDAEGGCCAIHPPNTPIFPEEWPMEALRQKHKDLGNYDYFHFYRNKSVLPEECIFKEDWLRYFKFKQSAPHLEIDDPRNILLIEHETYAGQVLEDIQPATLTIKMLVDIAHAKKQKRCDHCIMVLGYDPVSFRLYLLDLWAEAVGYSELVANLYKIAHRWQMRDFWLETVAAQNILKFYLDERNMREGKPLIVNELPYDNSENAKKNRIEALEPILKNNQIWSHRSHVKWTNQVASYPAGLVDVLDTMGYMLKITDVGLSNVELMKFMSSQHQEFANRPSGAGGY